MIPPLLSLVLTLLVLVTLVTPVLVTLVPPVLARSLLVTVAADH